MTGALQYRAVFDATVTFANGGGLTAEGFRVDVPGADTTEEEVGALFVASLGLLLADQVQIRNLAIVAEAHKGTRGGPSDAHASAPVAVDARAEWVDLSHPVEAGMVTYPGLPGPEISDHLSYEASQRVYAPGTQFLIQRISMIGNTGTYLDSPVHRYPGGTDLAGLPLDRLVDLPAVVVRTAGAVRAVDVSTLAGYDVAGCAVLLHTGGDAAWGTPGYAVDAPYLTEAGARWLVDRDARLVGIDAVNIDDISGPMVRPAHTLLLAAGIPVVEHLTGLDALPPLGARFTALPVPVVGFGTFPVRAVAAVPAGLRR